MAIIGKIRKHSGLAVILVGVAIAAFVIGDFSSGRSRGNTDIGEVNGEKIPYVDFNNKVETNMENQRESTGSDKISEQEAYQIRQSTWTTTVKEMLMGAEYEELGLTVTADELFDQIQGKQPHRYILQYFKDPATGEYNPSIVLNYLKNLDKMEPKAKTQWLQFEQAIKDDRQETKFNNLLTKGYHIPKAFLKKDYINQNRSVKALTISPETSSVPDSAVKITDADYQKFYDKNLVFFYQDEASRDLEYLLFEVQPSEADRKKIADDVNKLFIDFQTSENPLNFANANTDVRNDTNFVKKGVFPAQLDTLLFSTAPGTMIPPMEFNNAWHMAKVIDIQERPDSMRGSQILIAYAGTGNEKITRTKEEAKIKIDSLMNALKKNPLAFADAARKFSDYPTAKEDGGDLKWFPDGNPNFEPFFNAGVTLKPNEMKVVDTRIGYSLFMLNEKAPVVKKMKAAVLTRSIEPSNQTFQDVYLQASAFAGQFKTPEAFDKAAAEKGLQKRNAPGVRAMDGYLMGLPSARELVRWAFAETTKINEVSPVFDLGGKYAIAILKVITEKGQQPLEAIKSRIEPSVKAMKKIEIMAEKISKASSGTKDIHALAAQFGSKVDTTMITLAGYGRSNIGRELELVGKIMNAKKGDFMGPLTGNYGVYCVLVEDIMEAPEKDDFTFERMQQMQNFGSRVVNNSYSALEKKAEIKDNRMLFY